MGGLKYKLSLPISWTGMPTRTFQKFGAFRCLRTFISGPSQYRGSTNCNDDSIGIELEGLEGDTFENAQYEQLVQLSQHLQQRYPITHIAGHEHIAPGRKKDPGPGFDWNRLPLTLNFPNQ